MSFRMRNTVNNQNEENLSDAQKEAERIDFEHLKLKQYGDKYLYNPGLIDYGQTETILEKEELIFDNQTNRWMIVKNKN